MRLEARILAAARAGAVLAVVLLSLASVKSVVMQAADASPFASLPICAADASGGVPSHSPDRPTPAKTAADACAFCAAAAHAPLVAFSPPVAAPGFADWRIAPPPTPCAPRGPLAFRPRARAPPISPQTI